MAAIAKFVSYDGGIAFSDSVLKIQKREEERGRLIQLGNIDGIEVDEPLLGNDGCIRVQIAGRRPSIKNTIYFDEEQYGDALSFKKTFDSFRGQTAPALPPLEMFQPTSIAKRPQRQHAQYAAPERPRRPARQTRRRRRFRWWYALVAILAIGVIANAGGEEKKGSPKARKRYLCCGRADGKSGADSGAHTRGNAVCRIYEPTGDNFSPGDTRDSADGDDGMDPDQRRYKIPQNKRLQ